MHALIFIPTEKTISFLRTPFLRNPWDTLLNLTSDQQNIYDECRRSLPDIPSAEITVVNATYRRVSWSIYAPVIPIFYCRVETERGVIYSTSVTSRAYPGMARQSLVYIASK